MKIRLDNFILKSIFLFMDNRVDQWNLVSCSQDVYQFFSFFWKKYLEEYHDKVFHHQQEVKTWFQYFKNDDWIGIQYLETLDIYNLHPEIVRIGLLIAIQHLNPLKVRYMLLHNADNIEEAIHQLQTQSKQKTQSTDNSKKSNAICQIYYWLLFYQSMILQKRHLRLIS